VSNTIEVILTSSRMPTTPIPLSPNSLAHWFRERPVRGRRSALPGSDSCFCWWRSNGLARECLTHTLKCCSNSIQNLFKDSSIAPKLYLCLSNCACARWLCLLGAPNLPPDKCLDTPGPWRVPRAEPQPEATNNREFICSESTSV
jgi:hypothetical protein